MDNNPMDEVSRYNTARWEALVQANALFTRPHLDLDRESARRVDPDGRLGDLSGKEVLLLAGGGGQQSAAFALLGARVTVLDLSTGQLERDQLAAAHYGVEIRTLQGDMRDLSALEADSFDVVYQPYSLNFVQDAREVFSQVTRVIRRQGLYHFACANPFAAGLTERAWNGQGYPLNQPYVQGEKIVYEDSDWVYERAEEIIQGPQEFRQTLGTVMNGLIENGFIVQHVQDVASVYPDASAEPGTWDHFTAVVPPWMHFWAVYRPDILSINHDRKE